MRQHDCRSKTAPPLADGSLFGNFEAIARKVSSTTALEHEGRQLHYRGLLQASRRLAGYMQQRLGVRQGDRILLLLPNGPQFVVAHLAASRCGAVTVSVDPATSAQQRMHVASQAGVRVLVTLEHLAPLAQALQGVYLAGAIVWRGVGIPGGRAGIADASPASRPARALPSVDPMEVSMHDFASALAAGIEPMPLPVPSTDQAALCFDLQGAELPAGRPWSHRAVLALVDHQVRRASGASDGSAVTLPPLSGIDGLVALHMALRQGWTLVFSGGNSVATPPSVDDASTILLPHTPQTAQAAN